MSTQTMHEPTTCELANLIETALGWIRDHNALPTGWVFDTLGGPVLEWHEHGNTPEHQHEVIALLAEDFGPGDVKGQDDLTWITWPAEGARPQLRVYVRAANETGEVA